MNLFLYSGTHQVHEFFTVSQLRAEIIWVRVNGLLKINTLGYISGASTVFLIATYIAFSGHELFDSGRLC